MLIYNIKIDKQSWNIMKYFIPSSKLKKSNLFTTTACHWIRLITPASALTETSFSI